MSKYIELRKEIMKAPDFYHKKYADYIDESNLDLKKCLEKGFNNINPRSPITYLNDAKIYYIYNYVFDGLNGEINNYNLAKYCRISIEKFIYLSKTWNYIPTNIKSITAADMAELLAITAVTGWKDQFELVCRLCFKYLNDFIRDGFGVEFKWYMLLLAKSYLNVPIDFTNENNPLHGGKINSVWRNTITNWKEPNPQKFNQMMSDMADYHISQCHYGDDDHIYEFEDNNYWLFPIEILALLRIREWAGISNPTLTHPFFATSKLTKLQAVPEWPKDDMLDKVHQEFAKLYPDLPKIQDLPTLRREQN